MKKEKRREFNFNKLAFNFIIGLIVFIGVFSYPIFQLQDKLTNLQENNEHLVHMETFSDGYTNNSDETVQIRYKYILSHEKADSVEIEYLENERPLFELYEDGIKVASDYLGPEFSTVIPEISRTHTLEPGETSDTQFDIFLNKEAEELRDLIRFEVDIVVEEILNGRWSPVYQVNFMERGNNWRLNKTLIELDPID